MNKKIYSKLFGFVLIISSTTLFSCYASINCYKVGYSQEVKGTFFDEKSSTGYFIYSYLTKKNSKDYFLYKIDLNGKSEQITKIDSRDFQPKNYATVNTEYTFNLVDNNKLFLQESINGYVKDIESKNTYYLINLDNKEIFYKKQRSEINSLKYFSSDNKNILYYFKNGIKNEISLFNIEKGIDYKIDISSEIPQLKDTIVEYVWIDSGHIALYIRESKVLKKIVVYGIKDSEINKINEYQLKSDEPRKFEKDNYQYYYDIYPVSYENNIFTYYSNKNIYKLDFSKNELSLSREISSTRIPITNNDKKENINKADIRLGEKIYYIKNGEIKDLIDYREKLPKMFFDDTIICGNLNNEDIGNN